MSRRAVRGKAGGAVRGWAGWPEARKIVLLWGDMDHRVRAWWYLVIGGDSTAWAQLTAEIDAHGGDMRATAAGLGMARLTLYRLADRRPELWRVIERARARADRQRAAGQGRP